MQQGENKRKHLELIQDVITRMSGNSFLLKGWSITLITAVIGLSITADTEKGSTSFAIVALVLIGVFWLLDAYYLSQERAYRGLYNETVKKNEDAIDYSLNAVPYHQGYGSWVSSMTSKAFLVFYAPAFAILLAYCTQLIGIDIYLK